LEREIRKSEEKEIVRRRRESGGSEARRFVSIEVIV
jgi:hypothetical protein